MKCMHRSARSAGTLLIAVTLLGVGAGVAEAEQGGVPNQPASVSSVASTGKGADAQGAQTGAASTNKLPDSPGAVRFQIVAASQQDAASAPQQATPARTPVEPQPVGTAAAESITTTGVAASAPAGTAIAPAKQRQVRSVLIRMGAVLGASAAIGTAVALSAATPSKPPGAH